MADVEEHWCKDSRTCFVSFASMGEGEPNGCHFEWRKTLYEDHQASAVLLRDPNLNWYQRGVCGIGDVNDVVEYIRDLKKRFERVIPIGASMGGFAALMYGIKAGDAVWRIVAMVPQTFIDPTGWVFPLERRWLNDWQKMTRVVVGDIRHILPAACPIDIFLGNSDSEHWALDMEHAQRLRDAATITLLPKVQHPGVARALRDSGYFRSLL